jgi:CHAT domain-containing protein
LDQVLAVVVGGVKPTEDPGGPIRNIALVAASTSSLLQPSDLPRSPDIGCAQEELTLLRSLESAGAKVRVLPARRQHLFEALEQGGFHLLHLACHGSFGGPAAADASAVLLEDGVFTTAELSPRLACGLRGPSPLIFFNTCQSGRLGFSLTRLGSWGARLVQLGCGGFVGSLWPVTDRAALAFAIAFYQLLSTGVPIGEAVLQAKLQVRRLHPGDPTWLAYCCFADPMARVTIPCTPPISHTPECPRSGAEPQAPAAARAGSETRQEADQGARGRSIG